MRPASDKHPLYAAIDAKLAQIVTTTPEPPLWHQAWLCLGPKSTEQERLAVYQAIRAAGSLPEEAGFYLVSWQVDVITLADAEVQLRPLQDRLEAIRQAYGMGEDETWEAGEGPPEFEEAQRQVHDAWDALYAAKLDECGEHEMARLFREDREQFDQLSEAGRQFFHAPGAEDEDEGAVWLDHLLEAVSSCVEADSPMGPLGLRYREEDGFWEIWVYPTPVELLGGAHDGEVVVPGFRLDLEVLRATFESVVAFGWDALGLNDPDGPHIYIEGVFRGREVLLQVLAQAPADEEPELKFDTTKKPRRTR